MARPPIEKRVCREPEYSLFTPAGAAGENEVITLSVDEFETLRLIDLGGMSREECAQQMGIARTTAQAVYNAARRKTAQALVYGLELRIEGGSFQLCDGSAGCPKCRRRPRASEAQMPILQKETGIMRIAVTFENGQIFQHFGHTESFKIYDVEGTEIRQAVVCGANGAGHGALAGVLFNSGVDVLICGGLGAGAMNALTEAGIQVVAGASGDADAAVQEYLAGRLVSTGANCSRHDGSHSCGSHGCGSHGCH